jgi:beta-lactam-binding protein with PASTA domain
MRSFLFSGRNQNTAGRVALQGRKERKVFMRKALLIVAMLLSVVPVMATTTITAVNEGVVTTSDNNYMATVRIDYSGVAGVDANVRAFALDINIESGPAFQRIRNFKTGESNAASPGYGIFPSRFRDFIVVTGPNWADTNYNPTTAWNEPETTDHNSGMGWPKMIVEMGTLYAGDANRPALSGTLFRFDVNSYGSRGLYHITVKANALRGGVVNSDGNTITTAVFVPATINFPAPVCTVPNVVNQAEATATGNIVNAGFTLGTRTTTCDPAIVAGNVISTNPAAGAQPGCGTAVAYVVSTGPCTCTVPNVVNQAEATATGNIVNAGFTLGTRTTTCDPAIVAGNVISTNPAAGPAPCGSAVAYVVSTGPCPCTVPSIIGLQKAAAEAAITAAGFTVGTETGVFSDTTPVGQVTAQSPAGGSSATCGSAVTLSYVCRRVTCATCLGDVTGDNKIKTNDLTALTILLNTAGAPYSIPNTSCLYSPCGDLNGDGKNKTNDLTALTIKLNGYGAPYNHTCP